MEYFALSACVLLASRKIGDFGRHSEFIAPKTLFTFEKEPLITANDVILGRPRVRFRRRPVPVESVHEGRHRGFSRGVDRKVTVGLPPVGVPIRGVLVVVVGGVVGGGPVAGGPAHFLAVHHPVLVVAVAVQVA